MRQQDILRISQRPFFLFPLQLNSDYQIRLHSPFSTMYRAIDTVLESFASTAALGIADCVLLVDQGDLLEMIETSRGMVFVNSTSGTLALARDKPVKALGDPVYDMASLTDAQPLDAFRRQPQDCTTPSAACWWIPADPRRVVGNVEIELLVAESALRLVAPDSIDAEFG